MTWVNAMRDAVATRIATDVGVPADEVARFNLVVGEATDSGFSVQRTGLLGKTPSQSITGELVVGLDWTAVDGLDLLLGADFPTQGVAGAVASKILDASFWSFLGLAQPLVAMPIHLVGHSRGGSLVLALANALGQSGVWVDQVTTLDPHPVSGDFGYSQVLSVSENVVFADNYRQGIFDPIGYTLGGAHERSLVNLDGTGTYFLPHSDVHLWYHGTIQTIGDVDDGAGGVLPTAVRSSWYQSVEGGGSTTGFYWSALGGGVAERPWDGLSVLVGGNAARYPASRSGAQWPNVGIVTVSTPLAVVGSKLEISCHYQDFDTASTLTYFVDSDLNPFNGVSSDVATKSVIVTGSEVKNSSASWGTTGWAKGGYFVGVRITDGTHTRYAYVPDKVALTDSVLGSAKAADAAIVHGAGSTAGQSFFVTVNDSGKPIAFFQPSPTAAWTVTDINLKSGGGPLPIGQISAWLDPKDGRFYAAAPTGAGVVMYARDAIGGWTWRNLNEEVAAASASTVIGSDITVFVSTGDWNPASNDLVSIAGLNTQGQIVLFTQAGKTATNGDYPWTFVDLATRDLAANGQTTPAFVGSLASYVTSWNGQNIAGLDSNGHVQAVWWAPGIENNRWRVDDLSAQTGAPPLTGGLTPYLTPWGGINLAGTDASGNIMVTWWGGPGAPSNWTTSNLTGDFNGPALRVGSLSSYVTPWGGLNIAGTDANGKIVIYWWGGPGDVSLPVWKVSSLSDLVAGAIAPSGSITGVASPTGQINLVCHAADGDVLRYNWKPGEAVWNMQDLTVLAAFA